MLGSNEMVVHDAPPVEGILLVRGSTPLRDFCRDCMKQYGFRALEAQDGFEALLIAASRTQPVDLFVTDVENAQVSGLDLAAMLKSISPRIKVLILLGSGKNKRKAAALKIRQAREISTAPSHAVRQVVTCS